MTGRDLFQFAVFLALLAAVTKPTGLYLETIFAGKRMFLDPVFGRLERFFFRVASVDPDEEQPWTAYAQSLLAFSLVSAIFTYSVLRLQDRLPLNPQNLPAASAHLSFNTAMSFLTNTNWQSYGGESTLSYFSQMVALTIQNFTSAAVGICVAVALIRGISQRSSKGIGNFWADVIRCHLYLLLPACFVLGLFLISQGVIQNFLPYLDVMTLEGAKQTIAQGPVASQVAIKMLGTNGGGFFNANAAHPYENPTALSNLIQMLSIFIIPSGMTYLLGKMVKNTRHGWAVWSAMVVLFVLGVFVAAHFEYQGNPNLEKLGCSSSINWEGKETRFGIFNSALFATVTTDASCGAVNAMHDSLTPIAGAVPLINMLLGEVVFGGVGAGLYGMVLFILLTVFIAGLMVGRTPEYLGKKIEGREIKYVAFAVLATAFSILGFTAWAVLDPRGLAGLNNAGPHGLAEIFYAFTSATANNGSAFAGLSANSPFYSYTLGLAMFIGRFLIIIPMLAVAGSLAAKRVHAQDGTASFPVDGPLFTGLLIGVVLIVGALTFFPVLSLGPIVEHFEMLRGTLY